MTTPKWITGLQNRWHVKSTWQVIIILVVFACTGFTVMCIKPTITRLIFHDGHPAWFSVLYWVFIFPIYNLFLLFYGFIFGQFKFFWDFEKRFFSRLFKRKKEQP
jgi:hypothetical protein